MSAEIWKEIPGYGGNYFASDSGYIRSPNQILTSFDNRGYRVVAMPPKGVKKVHRLVALAFLENPEAKPQVNHKNGDKADNCLENLEWATASQNTRHGRRVLKKCTCENHPHAKLNWEKVKLMRRIRDLGYSYPQLGMMFGVNYRTAMTVVKRQAWVNE